MSLRVEGLQGVRTLLLQGQADAATNALAMRLAPKVKPLMIGGIRRSFDQRGPGWRPLKPATLRAKRRAGQPSKVGEASGRLKRSFSQDGAPEQTWTVSAQGFALGSTVPYAAHFDRARHIELPAEAVGQIRAVIRATIADTFGQRR